MAEVWAGMNAKGNANVPFLPKNEKYARYLDGLSHEKRVYQLSDSCGLAHHLLSPILSAALAAGQDVVACPDPMAPDRLAHLILPGLSLAFVTDSPDQPWPHRAHRHLRLDAVADSEQSRINRPRLRFSRKVASALTEEAVAGLAQAKASHDKLESLNNPHVDFDGVYRLADDLAEELLAGQ